MKTVRADIADIQTCRNLMDVGLDIRGAEAVQVQISKKGDRLWVNVNGVCVLRICQMPPGTLEVKNDATAK